MLTKTDSKWIRAKERASPLFCRPGVYVFKQAGLPIYIGSTRNLAKRPSKRDKGHASRWQAILQADATELLPCDSFLKAQQLEEQLIRTHHPIFNLRYPRAEADLERTARIIRENW